MEKVVMELSIINNELNDIDLILIEINKNRNELINKKKIIIDKLKINKHPNIEIKFKFDYHDNVLIVLKIKFNDGFEINTHKRGHNYYDLIIQVNTLFDWIKENPYTISSFSFLAQYEAIDPNYGFGNHRYPKIILDNKYEFESLYSDLNNINKLLNIINIIQSKKY